MSKDLTDLQVDQLFNFNVVAGWQHHEFWTYHLVILSNEHLYKRVEGGVTKLGCANIPHIAPHIFQTVPV